MDLIRGESVTPVEAIIRWYALDSQMVMQQMIKWSKWTKDHSVSWPKQGSCDPKLLTQMEGKILDYKVQDKSAKREIKRQQELKVLRAFMKLAKQRASNQGLDVRRGVNKTEKEGDVKGGSVPPPPYVTDNEIGGRGIPLYPQLPAVGQFPVVTFEGGFIGKADIPDETVRWQKLEEIAKRLINIEIGLGEMSVGTAVLEQRPLESLSDSEQQDSRNVNLEVRPPLSFAGPLSGGTVDQGKGVDVVSRPPASSRGSLMKKACDGSDKRGNEERSSVSSAGPYTKSTRDNSGGMTEPGVRAASWEAFSEQRDRDWKELGGAHACFASKDQEQLNRRLNFDEERTKEIQRLMGGVDMDLEKDLGGGIEETQRERRRRARPDFNDRMAEEDTFWRRREENYNHMNLLVLEAVAGRLNAQALFKLYDDLALESDMSAKKLRTEGNQMGSKLCQTVERRLRHIKSLSNEVKGCLAEDEEDLSKRRGVPQLSQMVQFTVDSGVLNGRIGRDREEVENEEEEEDGLAQAKSMAPVRLKDWGWRSSQKSFKRVVTQREEQEESVTRCREGSDSEDWDDLVIREQCPVTVFSKKEVLKEVGRENKEMRRMKEKIKQLEHVLIRNEEREREREGIQAPVTEVEVMMPLLHKGNVTHYQPWGHTDLDGLISRLPILQEGAGIWIGKLESEMEGKRLAVGDVKSLLSRILTKETTTALLNKVALGGLMGNSLADELAFDTYRNQVWRCLRDTYPNAFSLASMSVDKIKADENPAVFVERVEADWRMRMETDPESNLMVRHMMRKAIIEALPLSARNRLEDEHRIGSMTKTEFRDIVTHFVNVQRKTDLSLEKQDTERQRKLVQNQLDTDKGLKKGCIQAPQLGEHAQSPKQDVRQSNMQNSGSEPLAFQQPTPFQQTQGPHPLQQMGRQPYWNQPAQPYSQPQWGYMQGRHRGGGAGRGRGRGMASRNMNFRDGSLECWLCGQAGHISRDCQQRVVSGQVEMQPQMGEQVGLVSPFRGPHY